MPYGTNQYQNVMTKAEKASAPVVDLEKKEKTIASIKRAEEKLAKLRADIENDDNPDVTLFIATCNEKTSAVSSTIIGSGKGIVTTLASVIEDHLDLQQAVAQALILSR
jgi:type IV secretory pathway VirJ component